MYLPGSEELSAESLVERFGLVDQVRIEDLGHSSGGRPIPLLSFGEGPQSALIVGAPHRNEPTGCSYSHLSPVPLPAATDLQIRAVLTTARLLSVRRADQPTFTARPTATSDTGSGTQFGNVH